MAMDWSGRYLVERRMIPKIPWRAMMWDTLFIYSPKPEGSGDAAMDAQLFRGDESTLEVLGLITYIIISML
jgi:hypothetical protein